MCVWIFLVVISSNGTIWYVPLFPSGIYNERLYNKHYFSILKPLSVKIVEYIGNFCKYWLFSVSFLSDIAPLYVFETRFISEFGVTLNSTFKVWWCLYSDQVFFWSSEFFGVSMNISLASIIEWMSRVIFLNLWGFAFTKDYLSSINITVLRTVLKPFTHDVKTELGVERLTLYRFTRSCKVRPSLSFIKQSNISSLAQSFLSGPNCSGILLKFLVIFWMIFHNQTIFS